MNRLRCIYKYIQDTQYLNTKIGYDENDIILFDRKNEYNLNDYIDYIKIDRYKYKYQGNRLNDYIQDYDKDQEYNIIINFFDNINEIPNNFFRYIFNLTKIDILENEHITKIGDYAFQFTINLTNIIFNESINYIGKHAFVFSNIEFINLSNLKQLTLKRSCFCNCRNLTDIILPENEIVNCEQWVFAECFNCNYINKTVIPKEFVDHTTFFVLGNHEVISNEDYSSAINFDNYSGKYIIDENHELICGDTGRHFYLMHKDNNHFNFGGGDYFYDNTTNTISLFGWSNAFGPGNYDELKYYDHEKIKNIEFL